MDLSYRPEQEALRRRARAGLARNALVSILLPAFDADATIGVCLRSIQRQTEPRWECIVVDDGSADGTLARASSFAERDARFRVVAAPHRGLVEALNAGLDRCRAPFVARMDADDVMHRARLGAQLAALENARDLAAVGCHVRFFPRRTLRDGRRAYERWLNGIDSRRRVREEAFVECPVAHPTLVIRRETLAHLGYRDRGWPEDYDLVLRLLCAGHDAGVVPRRLLAWRDGPVRLSRTADRYGLERFTACKAAFLAAQFLAATEAYVLWGYGPTGRALRRALLAEGKQPSHIVELHPRRIGKTIHGALVIPPEALRKLPGRPIVVSVAGEGPRREIRHALAGWDSTRPAISSALPESDVALALSGEFSIKQPDRSGGGGGWVDGVGGGRRSAWSSRGAAPAARSMSASTSDCSRTDASRQARPCCRGRRQERSTRRSSRRARRRRR